MDGSIGAHFRINGFSPFRGVDDYHTIGGADFCSCYKSGKNNGAAQCKPRDGAEFSSLKHYPIVNMRLMALATRGEITKNVAANTEHGVILSCPSWCLLSQLISEQKTGLESHPLTQKAGTWKPV